MWFKLCHIIIYDLFPVWSDTNPLTTASPTLDEFKNMLHCYFFLVGLILIC